MLPPAPCAMDDIGPCTAVDERRPCEWHGRAVAEWHSPRASAAAAARLLSLRAGAGGLLTEQRGQESWLPVSSGVLVCGL